MLRRIEGRTGAAVHHEHGARQLHRPLHGDGGGLQRLVGLGQGHPVLLRVLDDGDGREQAAQHGDGGKTGRAELDEQVGNEPLDRSTIYRAILNLVTNAIDGDQYRRRGDSRLLRQQLRLPPDRLLIGAVVNLAPDLWQGVRAAVPFVDVVTTMLDDSIPLTTSEYDEWGNPHEKEYYEYMLSYSPYDNVEAKDYPALLVTTALEDSQVQYFEPAKWVAKMRAMKTDDNPLLLTCEMSAAGHGGVSGRYRQYEETALEYAFMLEVLNGRL